jgi:nucleoid-associated protein YgaU
MSDTSLVHADIINVDRPKDTVKVLFNPKEYTFKKSNQWQQKKNAGGNVPKMTFGGGDPASLDMELFFDTFTEKRAEGADPRDVRKAYTDAIWKMMDVDKELHQERNDTGRPPVVRFQWGEAWSFNAVIKNISQKFTLFLPNGTPVRATLTVTFQEVTDKAMLPATNPTSGGDGSRRVWRVLDGDTLAWIAYKQYGSASHWRRIADANRLTNVRQLTAGTVLVIPNG